MRVGYLGPPGTFSEEALMAAPGAGAFERVPLPTVYETVMAVHRGDVDRAIDLLEAAHPVAVSTPSAAVTAAIASIKARAR